VRCSTCGADLADDVRGCPACDADVGDSLPVLELDDTDLGLRTEDRYAYIPPGPNWIRRRVHGGSTRAPFALVAAVLLFFAAASLLRGAGTNRPGTSSAGSETRPALRRPTSTSLLLVAAESLRVVDVDRRRLAKVTISGLPSGPVSEAVMVDHRAVVVIDHRAYALPAGRRGEAVALGPATDVAPSAAPRRVWLVTYPADGTTTVQEVGLDGNATAAPATIPGGSWTARAAVDGRLVVERVSGSGARAVALWDPATPQMGPATIRDDAVFLAASESSAASRPRSCRFDRCDLLIDDARGNRQTLAGALRTTSAAAAFAPGGGHLAVVDTEGRGALVDLRHGSSVEFATPPVAAGNQALTWSRDGSWLFVATTAAGEVDAVDVQGRVYTVEAPSLAGAAVLTR
jgi:hypothetical protein